MANPEHVELVKQGRDAIRAWRKVNLNTKLNLMGANLVRANLKGADLRRADLNGASLSEANLRGADLSGAVLRLAGLSGADLRGADLSGAVLNRANLRGADLNRADLRGAYLKGADLRGADLKGADLSGVNPKKINFILDGAFINEGNPLLDYLSDKQRKMLNVVRSEKSADNTFIPNPINIYISPGDASPDDISELLAEISLLYRMMGGSGINFRLAGIRAGEGVLAHG